MNLERQNFAVTSETYKKNMKRGSSSDELITHDRHHHKERKILVTTSEISEQSKKIHASSDQLIVHDLLSDNRLVSEICGIGDQVGPNFSKQDVISPDSRMNIKVTSGHIALDESRLKDVHSEVLNAVDSLSHNQENENTLNIEENTLSNINISQETDTGCKVADIGIFNRFNRYSIDDAATIPGPSCTSEIISHSENTIEMSRPKLQIVKEMETKPSMCSACHKKETSKHFDVDKGKNLWKCCQCRYRTEHYKCLVDHISNHSLEPFYCIACNVSYSDASLHASNRTCNVCDKNFACKVMLEDHYFNHEKHHKTYCRICQGNLKEHAKGRDAYECCQSECSFKSKVLCSFKNHLYTHSDLKVFKCDVCGRRFTQISCLKKHSKQSGQCYKN